VFNEFHQNTQALQPVGLLFRKNIMKKTIITLTLATLLSAPVMATAKSSEQAPKRENKEQAIGLGSGALLGAALGGPVGAFIGALTGGLIGQTASDSKIIKAQHTDLVALQQQSLQQQDLMAQNEALENRLSEIEFEKNKLQQQRLDNLMAMTVQFRSGSSAIEAHFASQLDEVAAVLAQNPDLSLDLQGFADRRGDEQANLILSKQRVTNVKAYLVKQGVNAVRLNTDAFGEQHALAAQQDFEGDFFDRRVTLKAKNNQAIEATAKNQNY